VSLLRRFASDTLLRYRVMSYIVGTMLIILFIGLIPAINSTGINKVIGPIHGILYILYLLSVVMVFVRYRLGFWTLVAMVCAGFCPFLAFIVEHRVTRRLTAEEARVGRSPTSG
jgi:integral membrane protein